MRMIFVDFADSREQISFTTRFIGRENKFQMALLYILSVKTKNV